MAGQDRTRSAASARTAQWEVGRAARKRVPRHRLGAWTAPSDRADPVAVLQAQESNRVADLVPLRYERMTASPFTFYRGAAALMANDLATREHTGLDVQLCGDAHLANFGGYAAPDRTMVFDLNDFDETLPGPFEWDVARLVASFEVAGRHKGFTEKQRSDLVDAVAHTYRESIRSFASMSRLDVWYARLTAQKILATFESQVDAGQVARLKKLIAKGQSKTSSKAVSRYTTVGPDGALRLIRQPPLVTPVEDLAGALAGAELQQFMQGVSDSYLGSLAPDRRALMAGYHPVHAARKIVGVGSVGTRCWIALMVNTDDDTDDLVLQYKQAGPSVLEGALGASSLPNHGQRVVEGQRMIQAASDALLGWTRAANFDGDTFDFYVRQMWDWKTSADLEEMEAVGFDVYARICGWTLGRAHARSGSPKALAAYLGSGESFDRAMREFAGSYADQNDADYQALLAAIRDGRVVRSDLEGDQAPIDL